MEAKASIFIDYCVKRFIFCSKKSIYIQGTYIEIWLIIKQYYKD